MLTVPGTRHFPKTTKERTNTWFPLHPLFSQPDIYLLMAVLRSQSNPDHRFFLSLSTSTHASKANSQGTSSMMSSPIPPGKVKEFSLWTSCLHLNRDTCHIAIIIHPQICLPNLLWVSTSSNCVLIILHSQHLAEWWHLGDVQMTPEHQGGHGIGGQVLQLLSLGSCWLAVGMLGELMNFSAPCFFISKAEKISALTG